MQQPQLHTEQQQVTGSWILTVALPEDMLIGNSASQVARSASARTATPAVHATHLLGSSLLLPGGATLTLSMPGTCVRTLVSRVNRVGRVKSGVPLQQLAHLCHTPQNELQIVDALTCREDVAALSKLSHSWDRVPATEA